MSAGAGGFAAALSASSDAAAATQMDSKRDFNFVSRRRFVDAPAVTHRRVHSAVLIVRINCCRAASPTRDREHADRDACGFAL